MARSWSRICPIVVSREMELARGAELLTEAAAGHGALLLVTGEAGIGKSRLARALTEIATWRGFRTLVGVCQEHDRDCPYAPLLDALRALLHREGGDALAAIGGQEHAVLARLIPELGTTADAPVPTLPPEHEKRRIFEAFVHLCLVLSRDAPLLVVLEDLHWADATSRELVLLLARRLVGARVMMLATARSDEPGSDLAPWLAALERGRLVTRLELPPLTEPAVGAMIAATTETPLPPPVIAAIYARTEGNPFLIEELLHILTEPSEHEHEHEHETAPWPESATIMTGQIPAVVAQTVARRLGALDTNTRRVAEVGAAIGRRFSFDLLQRLTGLDEEALIAALRQLIAAQLVTEERAPGHTQFAFRHALTRDAIYERLLAPERRRLHRCIARLFATEAGDWPAPSDSELGYHAFAAGEWTLALKQCQRAGEQARALYAPQAAIEHFSRALIAAERIDGSRTDLLLRRGEAYEWMGDLERSRRDYEAALAEARMAADHAAEWRALMHLSLAWGIGANREGGAYAENALTLARAMDDHAATAHSLNRLGNFALYADQPFDAQRHHEQALAIFQSLNDARGIAETLERLGYARHFGADFIGGTRDLHEALDRYTKLDDRRGMVYSLVGLSERSATLWTNWMAPTTARVVDAIPEGERALQLSRESGWPFGESYSLSFLAVCIGAAGDYARALRWARDALASADEIGHPTLQFLAHGALSFLSLDLLALPLATHHLHRALALAQRLGSRHYLEGAVAAIIRMHLAGKEVTRAAAALHEHFPSDVPDQTFQQRNLWLAKAELALAQGDAALAARITDRLIESAPNRETLAGRGIPRIDLVGGAALTALGRYATAEETLHTAWETAHAQGARPLLWRLHCALGTLYQKTQRHSLAAREFAAAQTLIGELAATVPDDHTRGAFTRNALAMIPRAYQVSARRVAKERYGGLTQREREVMTRIAAGKMNREIAAALFVSEKTVELHVSNSLRKLGCRTRTELAAWAAASGLTGADADERAAIPQPPSSPRPAPGDDRPENLGKSL